MIGRASLPLLRAHSIPLTFPRSLQRTLPLSARIPVRQSQLRSFTDTKQWAKRNSNHQTPSSQTRSSPEARQREIPRSARPASDANDEIAHSRATEGKRESDLGRSETLREESSTFEQPEPQSNPETSESTEQTGPVGPLPDLTRGIPSTLEAELSQAQAKRSTSSASLNITEDPSEPLPGDEGDGRGRTPRPEYVSSSDRKRNTAFYYTYLILILGMVGYPAYLGRNWDSEEEAEKHAEAPNGWGFVLFYNRIKARLGSTISYYNDPVTTKLLPDEETDPNFRMPFTLVLSLEDMLIHQEWTRATGWRIAKRPGLDYFLRYLSQYYELVLFTSQPSAMADQVLRKLDPYSTIRWPLFREATLYKDGGYIKDLSYLNRDLKKVIIMDTNPHHVKHQPENAIVLPKWNGDPQDQTLVQMIPFLEYLANMGFDDARTVLKSFEGKYIPAEFARREKLLREKFEAQQSEKRTKRPKKSVGISSLFGTKQQSPDGMPSTEEAAADGKMLWDLIRERGQKNYMEFEKKIQEEGAKWLAEREAEEKRLQEEAMKSMTTGFLGGFFGGGGEKK